MSCMIDTHCHLDNEGYFDDLEEVIRRAKANHIEKIIIPGADPKDLPRAVEIAEEYPYIYFAIGIHPYEVESGSIGEFEHLISHPKCVGVGECGLDYYRIPEEVDKQEYKDIQKEVFISQIHLAQKYHKPLIVHIRDASEDAFRILREYPQIKGVLHCFNADEVLLGLSERFYYGIGGVATFKNARKIIEVLPKIPKNRILLETDAPYLTPHPHRGQRNEPMYIPLVAQKLSEVLCVSAEDIASISTQNAYDLFGRI